MYLTGGATAVLEGWRESTIDADILFEPDSDALLRRLAELKDELDLNVELASPLDFLPELPSWRERSPHLARYFRPGERVRLPGAVERSVRADRRGRVGFRVDLGPPHTHQQFTLQQRLEGGPDYFATKRVRFKRRGR
jgi:hypothetical protein